MNCSTLDQWFQMTSRLCAKHLNWMSSLSKIHSKLDPNMSHWIILTLTTWFKCLNPNQTGFTAKPEDYPKPYNFRCVLKPELFSSKKTTTQKTVDAKTVFYILILDFEPMSQTFLISYLNIWGKHRSGHWPWLSSSLIQLGEPLKISLSILNWWMLKG